MQGQRVALVVATLALVAVIAWRVSRCSRDERTTGAPVSAESETGLPSSTGSAGSTTTAAGSSGVSRARKLAVAERDKLLATIRESYRKRTGGTSATTTGPAPALPETPLDENYLRTALEGLIPLLSECYGEGLERDPKLQGHVTVDFTIESEQDVGAVIGESKVDDETSDLKDAAVRECMAETMHAMQMPQSTTPGTTRIKYTLELAPD
jgi:hypothetical protein